MDLERVEVSEVRAMLPPTPTSTPESMSQEESLLESEREAGRKLQRVKACRAQCGLTDREWQIAKSKFVINDDNRSAHEAAASIVGSMDFNLLLCGDAGLGKSRIAYGIVAEAVEQGIYSSFWTTTEFLMTLRSKSLATDDLQALQEMLAPKILVLDDFGTNKITEWSLMMMDMVIDRWYRQGRKGLIVTSNLTIGRIASEISDRIASRLAEMCRVFHMKGKDWRVSK
jgi:DNA replication protein DnaC